MGVFAFAHTAHANYAVDGTINNDCCDLVIDKQVSCDAGLTWSDSCTGWDDPADPNNPYRPEVLVRYVAGTSCTTGAGDLTDCELVDSNGAVLAGPAAVGTIGENVTSQVIFQTELMACDTDLEAGEPNTATLSCTCPNFDPTTYAVAQDTAEIQCLMPGLKIDAVCDRQDVWTETSAIHLTVTSPANPRGATLINCSIQARFNLPPGDDPIPIVLPIFDLAPGESIDVDFNVNVTQLGFPGDAVHFATVICQIAGAPGKIFVAGDQDPCETCQPMLDMQVSCDSGATWDDSCVGYEVPGSPDVQVRYLVDVPGGDPLFNCTLTDSNNEIHPLLGVDIGMIPGQSSGNVIHTTELLTCNETLQEGEPNTATLSCECYEVQSGQTITREDVGDIDCERCGDDIIQQERGETCEPNLLGDAIVDGGFEGGSPSEVWFEASTNFGTPLTPSSVLAGQFERDWFAWFGGIDAPEEGSVRQAFDLSGADVATLKFQRWLVDCQAEEDFFEVSIDGDVVYTVNLPASLEPDSCGFSAGPGYEEITIDLDAYLGRVVTVEFHADLPGMSDVFLDEISLEKFAESTACRDDCTFCGDGIINADEGCDDGNLVNGDLCDEFCQAEELLVELESFAAVASKRGVMLRWATSLELDTVGFRVLRGTVGRQKTLLLLTPEIIPAKGTNLIGAEYTFEDALAPHGTLVYYLEDVDSYGRTQRHGPVTIERGHGRGRVSRR